MARAVVSRPKGWLYVTAVPLDGMGPTTHIVETCRALARIRRTELVGPTPPATPIPGLSVTTVPLPPGSPVELRYQAALARRLPGIARRADARIVYVRGAAFNLGAMLTARRLGLTAILEVNGIPALEHRLANPASRGSTLRDLAYAAFARLDARAAHGIVTFRPELAQEVRRWGGRDIHVASNGVDPERFLPLDRLEARARLGLSRSATWVGYAGNFAPWQGIDTLLDGIARVRRLLPERDVRLLLVGDGVERAALEQRAAALGDAVHFTGRLPHELVPETLSACDVLAVAGVPIERNRRTGYSAIKAYEYIALRRPVLASDLPGLRFIRDEGLGEAFAAGDPASLATALRRLLDLDPAERDAMAERGRAAAEGRYSWETITRRIVAFAEDRADRSG